MKLFGLEIKKLRAEEDKDARKVVTFAQPESEDGSEAVTSYAGHLGYTVDISGDAIRSNKESIRKYREISLLADVDNAIEEIANEAIVVDEDDSSVTLNLDDTDVSDGIKTKIRDEFDEVLRLLKFNSNGHDIFRRWYIDGQLAYHKIVDPSNLKAGLIKLIALDPSYVKRIREYDETKDPQTGTILYSLKEEYFLYQDETNSRGSTALRINVDALSLIPSGLYDHVKKMVVGYLHKAIKPINQLGMMEDSSVIYRLSRAPERRVFYVDVGSLPKGKSEEYLRNIMSKYRNKLVYDASTGEIKDDRKHMTMLEDFWLPRREGSRGTEISTLPGGSNLGDIEDIRYFQKKLYRALGVPFSRVDDGEGGRFAFGRTSEITRDEVRFNKFINRLRNKFSVLFVELLRTQLILKNILTPEEWGDVQDKMGFDFAEDNYFTEFKFSEIMRERASTVRELDSYVGKYYSRDWIRRSVLMQSEDEIKDMDKKMAEEEKKFGKPEDEMSGGRRF